MKYLFAVVFFAFSSVLFSHGGGLDRYGCHNETKTGGYHCHRSSGWGGSISGSGSNLNQFEDKITNSWRDREYFEGEIKSLGAWGGDFILASGINSPSYFESKGYKTIVKFDDMIYRKES